MMADVAEVQVVVAHHECATLRVGDVFLKIDADQRRTDVEVEAMALAPIPTPEVLWRKPPVLALAALPGTALARLGEPSAASSAAWTALAGRARLRPVDAGVRGRRAGIPAVRLHEPRRLRVPTASRGRQCRFRHSSTALRRPWAMFT
jgi:hypothetical protein